MKNKSKDPSNNTVHNFAPCDLKIFLCEIMIHVEAIKDLNIFKNIKTCDINFTFVVVTYNLPIISIVSYYMLFC